MKHIKILSFLIITILFSSCEERVHLDQFPENVYELNRLDKNSYGDDPLLYNGKVFSGVVFYSYGSGEVRWEVFFKDGFKQKLITYYKDGKVGLKMNFVNNNRNGISEEYYDNGQLQEKITFVDGKDIGPYEKYDKNGQLRIKGTQKGYDKWDGLFEKYYENGKLLKRCNYKEGKLEGPYEEYFENGQLNIKYIKKNGEFDGPHEKYYENGQLKQKYTYKDGDRDGPYEIYFENGQLKEKGSHKEDKPDGLYEEYYENGELRFKYKKKNRDFDDGPYEVVDHEYGHVVKGIIKNGKFNGTWMNYSDKGELLEKLSIEKDKKNGVCEFYKDGKLYKKGVFENGKLVGDYEYNLINVDIPETDNNTSKSEEENIENVKGEIIKVNENSVSYGIVKTIKSYFYELPNLNNKKGSYIIQGQKVEISKITDDFVYGKFENEKNIITKGWLLKSDLEMYPKTNNTSSVPGKYPQSSTRQLTTSELTNLSLEELQIMRNEIFGRHGYIFKEGGEMNEYFSKQSWYKPQFSNVDSKLTPIEKSNIELILNEENNKESSLNDSNMTGLIKGNKINFRSTPSTESNENIIGELNEDYKVTILDKKVVGTNEGFRITKVKTTFKPINGDSSYSIEKGVSVKYLSEDSEKCLVQFNSEKGYISKSDLKSMEGISWYKIQYNEKVGWMYSEFIKTIE